MQGLGDRSPPPSWVRTLPLLDQSQTKQNTRQDLGHLVHGGLQISGSWSGGWWSRSPLNCVTVAPLAGPVPASALTFNWTLTLSWGSSLGLSCRTSHPVASCSSCRSCCRVRLGRVCPGPVPVPIPPSSSGSDRLPAISIRSELHRVLRL